MHLDALDARVARALDQLRQHGRRREHGGELAARKQVVRIGDIDAVDQLDRGAAFEPRGGHQRGAMRICRHQQHAVVRARHERQMRAQQHMRVPAAVVTMDDAFGASGRARGHDRLAPGARLERRRRDGRGRPRQDVFQDQHVEPERRHAMRFVALRNRAAHAHDLHRIGDVVRAEIEVDHEFGGAARHHAVARRHHARAVARQDRDRLAGPGSRRDHGGTHRIGLRGELRIGEPASARGDRDALAVARKAAQRGEPGLSGVMRFITLSPSP